MLQQLTIVGRSLHRGWPDPLLYYGALTAAADKSDRTQDIVCSLPTTSPGMAITYARELHWQFRTGADESLIIPYEIVA